jgi:hypothetical protein
LFSPEVLRQSQGRDVAASVNREIRTIFISPHADDIAYSLGGSILTSFFPRPFLIVTAFTRSITAPYYTGSHDVATVSRIRAREDDVFARRTGSDLLRWDLPEATLSDATNSNAFPLVRLSSILCGWPPPRGPAELGLRRTSRVIPLTLRSTILQKTARWDRIYSVLRIRISRLLSDHPKAILVSPLGIGNHPNHIVTSTVCRSLRRGVPRVYYYEDVPYASAFTSRIIDRYVRLFDEKLRPLLVDVRGVMDEKIANLLLYESQIKQREVARMLGRAKMVSPQITSCERVWTY